MTNGRHVIETEGLTRGYYPWLLPENVLFSGDRWVTALIMGMGGVLLVGLLGCIDFVRREESAPPNLHYRTTWAQPIHGLRPPRPET